MAHQSNIIRQTQKNTDSIFGVSWLSGLVWNWLKMFGLIRHVLCLKKFGWFAILSNRQLPRQYAYSMCIHSKAARACPVLAINLLDQLCICCCWCVEWVDLAEMALFWTLEREEFLVELWEFKKKRALWCHLSNFSTETVGWKQSKRLLKNSVLNGEWASLTWVTWTVSCTRLLQPK